MRQFHRVMCGFAAIVASTAMSISVTSAQNDDGSKGAASASQRTQFVFGCGGDINTIVRTENAATATFNSGFLTFASTTVSVPSGSTRCIKVLFTAEATCSGTAGTDFCYVRALDNGVEMSPQGAGFQTLVSEDTSANGHAYEWITRAGAGTHVISMQRRSGTSSTRFFMDDWTFDVTVHF